MNWFKLQLAKINRLADEYAVFHQQPTASIVDISEKMRLKRAEFIDAVQVLVDNVSKIKGITACAAYHDGLILAQSKHIPAIDAFGATIQASVRVAQQGATVLGLGDIEQIVIVGTKNKVAMLSIGPLILCISSPKEINLASALNQKI